MRRFVRPIPYAASATWTRRLAVVGAALALGSVVLPRKGVDVASALAVLAVGLVVACAAIGAAVMAAIVIWRTGRKGGGRAASGLALALATLAYPAHLLVKVVRDNPATDLSTDKDDPPQFAPKDRDAIAATLPPAVDTAWVLGRSPEAGEVEPITFDQPPAAVYRATLKAVTQLHWQVVSTTAPTPRLPTGKIDVRTYSTVMRLPEWIAIRVAPEGGQTRVDLRSVATRVLPLAGDDPLRNIQAFADAIEDETTEN